MIVGSGAKLLGPITVGAGAQGGRELGGHHRRAARTRPSSATPVTSCASRAAAPEGPDADWIHLPDPVADAIKALSQRIASLEAERVSDAAPGEVHELHPRRGINPAGG